MPASENNPRPIRPDDFQLFEALPGVACVARDQDLRMFWCSSTFFHFAVSREFPEDMKGSRIDDLLTKAASKEREAFHREVIKDKTVRSHLQLSVDRRVVCTVYPLDEQAFGHTGVFVVLAPAIADLDPSTTHDIPVLASPNLSALCTLSNRELEVLHYIASGLSTGEIATELSRSSKTVEKQINSIHSKLGTHSRAELVRFGTERGIQTFSNAEWSKIVEAAKHTRRELSNARNASSDSACITTDSE